MDEFFTIAGRENQPAWKAIAETLRATLHLARGNADAMQLLMQTLGGGDGQPTLRIARAGLLTRTAREEEASVILESMATRIGSPMTPQSAAALPPLAMLPPVVALTV